jgi:heme-degrading monooxygenase HmoA
MFIVVISFPPIKEGKDAEFREWFATSNEEFSKYKGFLRRRLLKPMKGGTYVGVHEHESQETFEAMHDSEPHAEARASVDPSFVEGAPSAVFYEVVVDSQKTGPMAG